MYRIAILDDNHDFCEFMELFLNNYFEASGFTNPSLLLRNIEVESYDLVLVDFSIRPHALLGIHDGCELIGYLKKHLKQPPLLVLFTGWLAQDALREGNKICSLADGFLAKDTDIQAILEQIKKLLASRKS